MNYREGTMKSFLVLLNLLFLFTTITMVADPPDPEDVLNPDPDDETYYFLQPYVGLGYSILTTSPVRPLSPLGLSELSDPAIESGGGLSFDLGLDIGYVPSENLSTRVGLFYSRRAVSNSGTTVARCILPTGTIDENVETEYTIAGDYLGLLLQADYYWSDFFGFIGYASSLPMNLSYEETNRIIDTNSICDYFFDGPDAGKMVTGEHSESPILDDIRHTVRIGAGYKHQLSEKNDLVIQLQYEHPLTNFLSSNPNVTMENPNFEGGRVIPVPINGGARFGTLYATVGIRFNHISL